MAVDKQKLLPINGMNLDSDEQFIPESQATFIKNHINAVNNLEDGASGGQSTNALTPYPSISTNFDDAYLPHLRSYTIDLSAVTFPATFVSFVRDTTEIDVGNVVNNIGDLSAIMVGSGWTSLGGGLYDIINTPYIWQKVIYRISANSYYSSALAVKFDDGAANGNNTCIGSYYDLKINQMVWFNYNDQQRHNIQIYNADSDTYQTVLETPLFNFSLNYRISSIDLVQAIVQTDEGANPLERLLYWTDKTNPPRKINIDRAIGNEYWNHSNYINYRTDDEFMCLVKYPPQTRIEGFLSTDTSVGVDYVDSNSYQFRQNFSFDDGEQSYWSDISSLIIARTNSGGTYFTNQVITLNKIDVGSSIVNKINIAYRIGNIGDWRQIITMDRANLLLDINISQNIFTYSPLTFLAEFKNDNSYTILDQATLLKEIPKVPLKAGSQEFLDNNILALADILTDYDNLPQSEINKVTVDVTYPITAPVNVVAATFGFMATRTSNGIVYNAGNVGGYVPEPFPFNDDSTPPNYNISTNYDPALSRYYAPSLRPYNFILSINWQYLVADVLDYHLHVEIRKYDFFGVFISSVTANGETHLAGTTGVFNDNFNLYISMVGSDYVDVYVTIAYAAGVLAGTFQWQFLSGSTFRTNYVMPQTLKGGGVYKFGIIEYDEANRGSFVNTNESMQKYINTVMENGGYYLQNITVNLNGLVFSDGAKKFAICRTQNTTINRSLEKGFIQWAVSSVIYVNDSDVVQVSPFTNATKVKIKIEGLDLFNTNNYNQTSTTYQFVQGDKVTLITCTLPVGLGGTIIPPATYGVITKDLRSTDGIELIFDMDDRLTQLATAGAAFQAGNLIEIWTPSAVGTDIYYEITEQFDIDQTTHTYSPDSIPLNTWDTYIYYRTLYPLAAVGTFTHIFESPSFSDTISDSQGEDIGRINVVNENAGQLWYPSLVRYSMPYVQDTFINGLSTFDSGREKTFFRQYGNITRMYCEQFNLCLIQEEKAFRVMVNRNLITSADGGNTVTLTTDILSDALEIQGNFGCQNGETFIGRQGQLFWWDLKRGCFVGGSFERVEDISALYDKDGNATGISTYALKQSKAIFNYNNGNIPPTQQIYVHTGFDPKNNHVIFTNWQKDDRANFVNNNPTWSALTNDTVAFKTAGYWQSFLSFTPENYSLVEGHRLGSALVSFKEGVPYFHNLNNETTYLNFYGTQCDKWFEIVSNKGDGVKNWMNISINSKSKSVVLAGTKYSAVSVKTSNNQVSTIPLPSFVQKEGAWFSNFYRNTNLGKTIITGDPLKGSFVKVKLKGDTTKNSEYNEVIGVTVLFNESKFTV